MMGWTLEEGSDLQRVQKCRAGQSLKVHPGKGCPVYHWANLNILNYIKSYIVHFPLVARFFQVVTFHPRGEALIFFPIPLNLQKTTLGAPVPQRKAKRRLFPPSLSKVLPIVGPML